MVAMLTSFDRSKKISGIIIVASLAMMDTFDLLIDIVDRLAQQELLLLQRLQVVVPFNQQSPVFLLLLYKVENLRSDELVEVYASPDLRDRKLFF